MARGKRYGKLKWRNKKPRKGVKPARGKPKAWGKKSKRR